MANRKPTPEQASELFWAKVDRRGPDECWPWTGYRHEKGYGITTAFGRSPRLRAHRAVWLMTVGPIPDGLRVLHRCDNPPCCNVAHLFLGTDADNTADMLAKNRHSHGSHHGSKLTDDDVIRIRTLIRSGTTCAAIAVQYGLAASAVRSIKSRRNWAHLP
jgi:hypothetical protein